MKLYFHSNIIRWAGALCVALVVGQTTQAEVVRLHGGVSISKAIESKKAAIEAKSGAQLEIVGSGAGRGLNDLSGGFADIALLSGPLKGVAEAMNKEKPGSVDLASMKEIPFSSTKMSLLTHPSAGVKSFTQAQLRDVFTGKTANWKEVGGADLPIKVVIPFAGDGARVTLQATVLEGAEYAKGAIVRVSSKDVPVAVAQLPGACAVLASENVTGNVITVPLDKDLPMPWALVVKGEPSGAVKKVVEAVTELIK